METPLTATATASSSSADGRTDLDLLATGRLPPIPTALIDGRHHDLISPLRFLPPGELPRGDRTAIDRTAIAAALTEANTEYGHPRAKELGERLADPATRVIATGQQPGLYGGPLLTLTKMAAAVRWAETLEAAGESAVAVFWVATEDHDWSETTKISLLGRDGSRSYDLGADPAQLVPVGARMFGEPLGALEERLKEELSDGFAASGLPFLHRFYHPEASFGEAFAGLFIELLGERAPLFLDSRQPAVKRLQGPTLRRIVERRREIDEELDRASAELKKRQLPQQVRHQSGNCPLFLIEGDERRRIVWEGDEQFVLRGSDAPAASVEELLRIADEEPERLSPGVLARPAVQDALLGTTLQVMGPAEISYLTQASAVYRVAEVTAPWTSLRPQAMVLEERQLAQMAELGVSFTELLSEPLEELLAKKLHKDFVQPIREQIDALLATLQEPVVELEAQLEKPYKKTRDQIGRAFDQLQGKITGAVARRNDVWHRRLGKIREQCLPEGHLQERHLSVAHYVDRYGPAFAEAYWSDFDLDPRYLQILTLRPGGGS
jgi:bacillithiol biosynthesis cysteine-adding enzyme BshC